MLPAALLGHIERLWGSIMLPRWPDRIVSEISPYWLMAETFGPALRFWQGCALTAWFVCEGPYSRTDISGLRSYHQEELEQLEELKCGIPQGLFTDLERAEQALGPLETVGSEVSSTEMAPGLSLTIRSSGPTRRSGFEHLRNVINQRRQEWADDFLDTYLRQRWETELKSAAHEFARFIAEKTKAPTAKQFARSTANATNHWFGGDLADLYSAIGEASPVQPMRVKLMPKDQAEYATRVFQLLGGRDFERPIGIWDSEEAREQNEAQDKQNKILWLAEQCLRFTQLEEALGRPPDLKEFGPSSFEHRSVSLAQDIGSAWKRYRSVVAQARDGRIQR